MCANIRAMRNHQQRNGPLSDEERQDPEIRQLIEVFGDVDLLEEILYSLAFEVRDTMLTDLVEKAGDRGPGRGLSIRIGNELNQTDSAVKAMKSRTRRRRKNGEQMSAQKFRAVRAALRAASVTYRQVMDEEGQEDERVA